MTHKVNAELDTERLTAYLEGEVTLSEASKIEAELRESPAARRRLESLRNIRDALSEPTPEHRELDLVPSLREALKEALPAAIPKKAVAWQRSIVWLATAAACVLVVGTWVYRQPSDRVAQDQSSQHTTQEPALEEFRAKSNSSGIATPSRWAGVRAFRVKPAGKPEPLTGTLCTGDGLLFSYTNLGSKPFDYLVIFAVDAQKTVRWFYPAYEQPGTNPASIGIKHDLADVPLPELIHQNWAPGPVAIHALFSSRPLHVLEVEGLIEQSGGVQAYRDPVNISGTLDQVTTAELVP